MCFGSSPSVIVSKRTGNALRIRMGARGRRAWPGRWRTFRQPGFPGGAPSRATPTRRCPRGPVDALRFPQSSRPEGEHASTSPHLVCLVVVDLVMMEPTAGSRGSRSFAGGIETAAASVLFAAGFGFAATARAIAARRFTTFSLLVLAEHLAAFLLQRGLVQIRNRSQRSRHRHRRRLLRDRHRASRFLRVDGKTHVDLTIREVKTDEVTLCASAPSGANARKRPRAGP